MIGLLGRWLLGIGRMLSEAQITLIAQMGYEWPPRWLSGHPLRSRFARPRPLTLREGEVASASPCGSPLNLT